MNTETYYVLVQIAPNASTNDRVSIGLIAFDGKNVMVRFSQDRQHIAKKLLGKGEYIVHEIAKQIEVGLTENPERLKQTIVTKGADNDWVSNYMQYLQRYSNGTVRFSDSMLIIGELTQTNFDTFFDKFLGENTIPNNQITVEMSSELKEEKQEISEYKKEVAEYQDDFEYDGSILDKMYYSLKRFDDFFYLPSFFIESIFPFQGTYTYISQPNMYIENLELSNFFKNMYNITNSEDKDKLEYVLKKLNEYLIFNIIIENKTLDKIDGFDDSVINIDRRKNLSCDCAICSYNRFDFFTAFSKLYYDNKKYDLSDIKNAYAHSLFGNYKTSYRLFLDLSNQFRKENNYAWTYICLYNIKKIGNQINGSWLFMEIEERLVFIDEIAAINRKSVLKELNSKLYNKQEDLFDFIDKERLVYYYYEKIAKQSREIIRLAELHQKGDGSNDNKLSKLYYDLINFWAFYTQNNIIFENFKEFSDVIDIAIEAFIASHAIDNENMIFHTSKLEFFNNILLDFICEYINTDKLLNYVHKYKLSCIKARNIDLFLEKVENLFTDKNNFYEVVIKSGESTYMTFVYRAKKIMNNAIILIGLIDVDTNRKEYLYAKSIDFFMNNIYMLNLDRKNYLRVLFSDNILCNSDLLKTKAFDFLNFTLLNFDKLLGVLPLLYELGKIFKDNKGYKIYNKEFLSSFLDNIQYTDYLNATAYIYHLYEKNIQNELKIAIEKVAETNFNSDAFYELIISGVLDVHRYIEKFTTDSVDFQYAIALAQTYNLPTDTEMFNKIAKTSDFFAWLVAPEAFDYDKFILEWFYEIRIYVIFERINKVEKVKEILVKAIKDTQNEGFKDIYFRYFV